MQKRFPVFFKFYPMSWAIPAETNVFRKDMLSMKGRKIFIIKPSNGRQGKGLRCGSGPGFRTGSGGGHTCSLALPVSTASLHRWVGSRPLWHPLAHHHLPVSSACT